MACSMPRCARPTPSTPRALRDGACAPTPALLEPEVTLVGDLSTGICVVRARRLDRVPAGDA
jgi:hypothetical protein